MVISPEQYYEIALKDKSKDDILSNIRGLKNKIGHLKKLIEKNNSIIDFPQLKIEMMPSYQTQIDFCRIYLELAKKAYKEAKGEYKYSKAELKAIDFEKNISNINQIVFNIYSSIMLIDTYIATFSDKGVLITKTNILIEEKEKQAIVIRAVPSCKEFIKEIKNLHMGEWKRTYSLKNYGYDILDGCSFEITIKYDNNHKDNIFEGSNIFPYNFNQFEKLFNIE